ncbi:hypothetical protein DS884_03690 [Tenacibaculum sp. E3R01]|uniref:hypothetical protein n=1 Tax=Tenacibaculum sp. E3R01 TaxID=2267227 RepID=UPI000DE9702F|nr:hypothetical protein [Tenacibaculum sp. E3R01]RBW61422.1 hypothetical protein DS884_03690 [Tenacibaculum sp. E3R01]
MRYLIKLLLTSLILISCKNNEKKVVKEFYYPNKSEFSKSENYRFLEVKEFKNFNQLVDSLENLNYRGKKAYLKIENVNARYNYLTSTTFGQCYPILLKFKNILSISKDSIKKEKDYPIGELKTVLKKDLLNFGKNNRFSDSPGKLVISLTSEIDELENLILKVTSVFNEIQKDASDSLKLNIYINRRMEIYLPPPKIKKIK